MRRAILVILLCAAVASPAPAQEGRTTSEGFSWSEQMAAGAQLRIANYSGPVEVRETSGNRVEVRAVKRPANGELPEVHFELVRDGENVIICAMPVQNAQCEPDGLRVRDGHRAWRRGTVAFTVLLPRGVRIHAGSSNGAVTVENAGAEVVATSGNGNVRVSSTAGPVRASSGNGRVEVSEASGRVVASSGNGNVRISTAEGPVNASSGNGNIEVSMRGLRAAEEMTFRTGNGRIVVRLPADFQGEVDASTGRGGFNSDFPMTVQGRLGGGRVRGTIGTGGARIRMSSGNGGLELRRLE